MTRLPGAIFVVDIMREHIAIKEAQKLNIPIFAMVDTNSDPVPVDFPIPANDDAGKSIEVIMGSVTDAVAEGLAERKAEKQGDKEGKEAPKKEEKEKKKIRERREKYLNVSGYIDEIIYEGTMKTREEVKTNVYEMRKTMGFSNVWSKIKRKSENYKKKNGK